MAGEEKPLKLIAILAFVIIFIVVIVAIAILITPSGALSGLDIFSVIMEGISRLLSVPEL